MQNWEYKILVVDVLYDENLNAQGRDGWELVGMHYGLARRPDEGPKAPKAEHERFHLIFKRPRVVQEGESVYETRGVITV